MKRFASVRTWGFGLAILAAAANAQAFEIEEATIPALHAAIKKGDITCKGVVEAYVARAKAYNGICTALLTADGRNIPVAKGYVRAGAPLTFPTKTVAAAKVFPDLAQYKGRPLDFGRMEPTKSDPTAMHQMGMRVGIPNAGQINALETLNLRGERSITCKGAFDAHPSTGPLPADAPPACDAFRRQPDALERAAELDAQFGANPNLDKMPMYCVVTAVKDPYDTKDMRTTANSDVAFAMDVPPNDAVTIARLRAKGAIIYAKSVASEFNDGPSNPGGQAKPTTHHVRGGQQMSAWSGQACNPYDTERVPRGSSGGSGAAIGANLAMIGICEQTGASCQGPASRNGIALILPTKGLMTDSGGIGNQAFIDRAGIHARTLDDAARVLDAVKDSADGYYDANDIYAALPKQLVPERPYASFAVTDGGQKPLAGLRIAIVREHMVKRTRNHEAISDQTNAEFKAVLRDKLGAELIEMMSPDYPDDAEMPNLTYTFSDALSELLPQLMPEIFARKDRKGELVFAVPGYDVTSHDYLLKLSRREAPLTSAVNITNWVGFGALDCSSVACADFRFDMNRYLAKRGDTKIKTWKDWVANAKFKDDEFRTAAENWAMLDDHGKPGTSDALVRSYVGRLALMKVMHENKIDAFVHPENTVPTPKIQGANVGTLSLDGITPFLQIPRVAVPAGFTNTVVEPRYALNEEKTGYTSVLPDSVRQSKLAHPMPISITFFAGQGDEPMLIKIGTAYEAITRHRAPPPAFGPLDD
jgi:Asp-tRNA(Asn)/Glu-tRNA(Gln) amidotransferase A subunit family amidase